MLVIDGTSKCAQHGIYHTVMSDVAILKTAVEMTTSGTHPRQSQLSTNQTTPSHGHINLGLSLSSPEALLRIKKIYMDLFVVSGWNVYAVGLDMG